MIAPAARAAWSPLAAAALLAFPASAAPAPAAAKPRVARCVLNAAVDAPYRGPCRFLAERGGSFSVAPVRAGTFFGDVTSVSVAILSPGVAEVRGLTTDGVNSRWGEARRSRRDKACWQGADFTICVY